MKKIIPLVILLLVAFNLFFSALPASAQPSEPQCEAGYEEDASGVCFPTGSGLSDTPVATIIQNLLMWLLGIFGMFAIIGFIISGIQYLTSAGDDKMIETAKRNMKWSLVGVVVALSGFVIIKAVDAMLKADSFF